LLPLPASFFISSRRKNADQVLRSRRHHQLGERYLFGREHRGLVAAVLFPEIDQRVGRGIMRMWRGLLGFFPHARGEQPARGRGVEHAVEEARLRMLETAEHRILHRIVDVPLLADGIHQAKPLGAPRIDGAASEHQGHRLRGIHQAREARGATETGMQAEHHLGEAEARAIDGDARLAGERHLQAAAEAEAVDDRDRRQPQRLEAIDHRMRAADFGFDGLRIAGAAKRVDVGAGDEAGCFRRADDEARRTLAFQLGQDMIELFHHIGGERVGAGAFAVEQQPGDAVGVAGQFEIAVGAHRVRLRTEREHAIGENVEDLGLHHHTVSISIAPPCPPPMHSVAMPRRVPSRFIALTRCSTMRLPLVPTGWPNEIAPPSTLSFDRSISPAAPSRPNTSLQNFSSFQAARQPSTCVAKASFNSQVSTSCKVRLLRFSSGVADITGPSPMMDGSSEAH
jgi:hypothetical protein